MKYIILSIFLFGCSPKRNPAKAQTDSCGKYYDNSLKMDIYKFTDQMPSYPGGMEKMMPFIGKNFMYPEDREGDQLQTSVRISFIADKSGQIKNIAVYEKEKKTYSKLDLEMIRVIGLMPKWVPGSCNGKKVPVFCNYRISF